MNRFLNVNDLISFIESQRRTSIRKDLSDMFSFCKILGNPEKDLKVVHVTGTNGKGSVVSYLKYLFIEHGLNIGTFTSPYIVKFNERICHNFDFISDEDLLKFGNIVIDHFEVFKEKVGITPSFFELITLIAFLYFKSLNLDLVILEVGIGGLLDSTNVITPIASAIVNISYDHMNILGDTIEEILINKLGIVKENKPLICGLKDESLINIAKDYCLKFNSKIYLPLLEEVEIKKCDLLSSQFILDGFGEIEIMMLGYHQIENALVALKTFLVVSEFLQLKLDKDKILKAFKTTTWVGRLEKISNDPLIIVDGAHNVDGIKRIVDFLEDFDLKKRVIFACSNNKEKEKMVKLLEPVFNEVIITEFSYKRHTDAKSLFDNINHLNKLLITKPMDAIDYTLSDPFELNIFIGSLYFVSEIRPILINKIKR